MQKIYNNMHDHVHSQPTSKTFIAVDDVTMYPNGLMIG